MISSTQKEETNEEKVVEYMEGLGNQKTLAGLLAVEALQDNQDETQANREAESEFARRELWGGKSEKEGGWFGRKAKKMRQIIGGDYHVHGTDLGKLVIGAGLMLTGAGIPIGGYLIADALKQPAAQVEDATARVKVLWGDKEVKPGEPVSVEVNE